MELKIYRISATGLFGYIAFDGDAEVFRCDSSTCNPLSDLCIHVSRTGMLLDSPFDPEITMVPGITSRVIRNRKTGSPFATLRYEDDDFYSVLFPEDMYTLEDRDGDYLFFAGNEHLVMTMTRLDRNEPVPPSLQDLYRWLDLTPCFRLTILEEIPVSALAVLANIPMLRFDRRYTF